MWLNLGKINCLCSQPAIYSLSTPQDLGESQVLGEIKRTNQHDYYLSGKRDRARLIESTDTALQQWIACLLHLYPTLPLLYAIYVLFHRVLQCDRCREVCLGRVVMVTSYCFQSYPEPRIAQLLAHCYSQLAYQPLLPTAPPTSTNVQQLYIYTYIISHDNCTVHPLPTQTGKPKITPPLGHQ